MIDGICEICIAIYYLIECSLYWVGCCLEDVEYKNDNNEIEVV